MYPSFTRHAIYACLSEDVNEDEFENLKDYIPRTTIYSHPHINIYEQTVLYYEEDKLRLKISLEIDDIEEEDVPSKRYTKAVKVYLDIKNTNSIIEDVLEFEAYVPEATPETRTIYFKLIDLIEEED
jgi:hypothetical protein